MGSVPPDLVLHRGEGEAAVVGGMGVVCVWARASRGYLGVAMVKLMLLVVVVGTFRL